MGETLQAAAGDPEIAEDIRRGRLTREQRAASIGLVGPAVPAAPPKGKKGRDREAADRKARQQQARRRNGGPSGSSSAAEKRVKREQAKLERARDAAEEAKRSLNAAELDSHAARGSWTRCRR